MKMTDNKIHLIVADDSTLVIEGIRNWIQESPKIVLISMVNKFEELESLVEIHKDAVLLSSIHWILKQGKMKIYKMIHMNHGIKYAAILNSKFYNSIHALADIGIKGFVGEMTTQEELLQGLCDLKKYHYYMAPDILGDFLDTKLKENGFTSSGKIYLTKRETEILDFVLKGKSSKNIARSLSISKRTVDGHRANINNKFGVKNTAQLYKTASKYLYTL